MQLNSKRPSYKVAVMSHNKFMFNVNVFVGPNEGTIEDVLDKVDDFLLYECPDFDPKLWPYRELCAHDVDAHVQKFSGIVSFEDLNKLSRFLID